LPLFRHRSCRRRAPPSFPTRRSSDLHFRNPSGPTPRATRSVQLLEPLRAGNVSPGELALDPNFHPNRTELDLGVDLRRLQVAPRSEEHTSELQSLTNLVCRLLLEKNK